MNLEKHLIPFFLLLFALPIAAQHSFVLHPISMQHGLSDNTVYDITDDDMGRIWIATENGLNCYDGYGIKRYQFMPGNEHTPIHNKISALTRDKDGNVWFGTSDGLNEYHAKSDLIVRHDILSDSILARRQLDIKSLLADDSILWIGTYGGLVKYNMLNRTFIRDTIGFESAFGFEPGIFSIYKWNDDSLWVGTNYGLYTYLCNERKFKPQSIVPRYTNSYVLNIKKVSENRIWLQHKSGIYSVNKFSVIEKPKALSSLSVKDFEVRGDSCFLITDQGFFSFHPEKNTLHPIMLLSRSQQFNAKDVSSIFFDRFGCLWLGTKNTGVSYSSPSFANFNPLIVDIDIAAITKYYDNEIFIASQEGQIFLFNTYTNKIIGKYVSINGVSGMQLILHKGKKYLWVSSYNNGIEIIELPLGRKQVLPYSFGDTSKLMTQRITSLFFDKLDSRFVWIGTIDGFQRYDLEYGTFKTYRDIPGNSESLPNPCVTNIVKGKDHFLWLITDRGGLTKFDKLTGKCKNYQSNGQLTSLATNQINCSLLHNDSLWLGTSGGLNLFHIHEETFEYFSTEDGLIENNIVSLVKDDVGSLWIGTHHGLSRFEINNKTFTNYTVENGLISNQFSYKATLNFNDTLFFGTNKGLFGVNPQNIVMNQISPSVYFTQLKINNQDIIYDHTTSIETVINKSIRYVDKIKLSHKHKVFSIEITAMQLAAPKNNIIEYQLIGFDKYPLTINAGKHELTYTNLDPGEYLLKVRARNSENPNHQFGQETLLSIIVEPAPWLTWWAKTGYLIIIMFAVFFIIRLYLMRERIRAEQQLYRKKLDFFTFISHELRTPLTLMSSPLEELEEDSESNKSIKNLQLIQRIRTNMNRLLDLISQLLDIGKIDRKIFTPTISNIHLVNELMMLVDAFTHYAERYKINVRFTSKVTDSFINTDQEIIRKSIENLLLNAVKFTPEGGSIDVVLSEIEKNKESYFCIKVSDTGIGIAPEELTSLFEPFHKSTRSLRNIDGSGVGLFLVKELLTCLNAAIEVQSEQGKGSSFFIYLPVPDKNQSLIHTVIENDQVSSDEDITKVLIVEDNEELNEYIASLMPENYEVIRAFNGHEGFVIAEKAIPDIIISDVMMPVMNGIELCRKIRENILTSHIPFILLTARTAEEQKLEGFESGADDYIIKPFSKKILLSRINNLIIVRKNIQASYRQFLDNQQAKQKITASEKILNPIDTEFLQKFYTIVNQHIDETLLSTEKLAGLMNISRTHLYRKINALTGTGPNEMLRSLRLEYAAKLLKTTSLQIAEIHLRSGFESASYFTKCFKEKYNMTPSEYRG